MGIFAPPLRRSLQEFQRVETQVIGDGSRVRVSNTGVGLGIWQTWTDITYANLTVGNGTVVARYVQIGKTVIGHFIFTLGSTSAIGTAPTVTPPITASSSYVAKRNSIGNVYMLDAGTGVDLVGSVQLESTTLFRPFVHHIPTTYMELALLSATIPFTWGSGDFFAFSFTYEAA